jgi:hypothetical protein
VGLEGGRRVKVLCSLVDRLTVKDEFAVAGAHPAED